MGKYITTLTHFRFERDDDELIVTTHRDEDVESTYEWKEEYSMMSNRDLQKRFHESMYTDLCVSYQASV